MNERLEQLIEISRKKVLQPAELTELEAIFSTHPELRAQWEEERKLSELIASLPAAPLSANFTEQVLSQTVAKQFAKHEVHQPTSVSRIGFLWANRWLRVAAMLCILFALGTGAYMQYNHIKIQHIAESLSTVAETASMVAVVSESDLEAIKVLGDINSENPVDNDLWFAMVSY